MNTSNLTEGSILKKLFSFFFPVLFGMLFQQLYNTVDAVVVGRCVGPEALAAVGGSPAVLINLVLGFFNGLAGGAAVIVSQYFGSGDEERLSKAVHTVYAFCIICGLALTVIGIVTAQATLLMVKTPADIIADSRAYMQIFYTGMAGMLIFNIGSGILRAVGDSRSPLIFLAVCCILNILLDLLFVAVMGMGVPGVAWATVASVMCSAVLVTLYLMKVKGPHRLILRRIRFDGHTLRRILYIGVPAGLQGSMYCFTNIVIQAAINGFGTVVVAAWTATGKVDGIFWVTSNSFGMAICTFVGQCFGAGKYDRMREGVKKWLGVTLVTSIILSALILGLCRYVLALFTANEAVLETAVQIIWYFAPVYFIWTFIEILSNTLRGAGDVVIPTVISLIGICATRILWVLLVLPHWHTILGVSISYPVSWTLTSLALIIYYFKGSWIKKRGAKAAA